MQKISIDPEQMKTALETSGWLDGRVVAAGQLHQGKQPSTASMVLGGGLIEIFRRRTKLLPRHFVMAVTEDRVVAFKCSGTSPEDSSEYTLHIKPGEEASFPRSSVRISDLPDGPASKGGTMTIDGESFPFFRGSMSRDACTDELLEILS